MKQLISSRNVSIVGKLCAVMLALSLLCTAAPSYAELIENNYTGEYVIAGDDTWGVRAPYRGDNEVSSIFINEDASLTLRWDEDPPYIFGNGDMKISGGGRMILDLGQDDSIALTVWGLNNMHDITLSTVGNGQARFNFHAFSEDDENYLGYNNTISSERKELTVKNIKQSDDSDISSDFLLGAFSSKNVNIDGNATMLLEASDFNGVELIQAGDSFVNISGGSEISITDATVISNSSFADKYGVGGTIKVASIGVTEHSWPEDQVIRGASYKVHGESRVVVRDVTVASKGAYDGYLSIWMGADANCWSDEYSATAEIESSYAEISNIRFDGTGKHSLHVYGGGVSTSVRQEDTETIVYYQGIAESRINGNSEIVISGNETFKGLTEGVVYCGGGVMGENAVSTVGNVRLTLKDMDATGLKWGDGEISGQGWRQEYTDNTFDNMTTSDYTDSVLGDSVLVLYNVKADMASDTDKVTVKYFDEIQLANNTAVKLTTLDGDVKKLTVTGAWGAEVTALEFKQPVQNFASISVDYSAASGVTDAYFTDDGMKFIVNGTGGTTPDEPTEPEQPSTGGSGGGGGCNAGFGFGGLLALAGLAAILRKNGGR